MIVCFSLHRCAAALTHATCVTHPAPVLSPGCLSAAGCAVCLQLMGEASTSYYHLNNFAKHLPFQGDQRRRTWRSTTDCLHHQQSCLCFHQERRTGKFCASNSPSLTSE